MCNVERRVTTVTIVNGNIICWKILEDPWREAGCNPSLSCWKLLIKARQSSSTSGKKSVAIKFLHRKNTITFSWPVQSPVLNFIENLGLLIQTKLQTLVGKTGEKRIFSVNFRIDWNHNRLCQITISIHNPQIT